MKTVVETSMIHPSLSLAIIDQSTINWHHSTMNGLILAEVPAEQDVILQIRQGWDNFVESGQIWALIIGFFIGYLLRSLTAY